jgi:hypothetical protein
MVTTMRPLEDGSEVFLVECPKCHLADMFVLAHGALRWV